MMDGYVDAVIRLRVPKWQVGQEAFVYFADTMSVHATCEEPKKGKWILDKSIGEYRCSECGRITNDYHDELCELEGHKGYALILPHYCGNCGARMEGEENE